MFDTGGHLLRAVGQAGSGPGQLNFPYGVAADAAGRVFVADDLNHRVVRFSSGPDYPYKGRWGSYGTAAGRLAYPRGIAVDPPGQRLRGQHRQRPHRRLRQGRHARCARSARRAASLGQFDAPMGVAADAGGVRAVTDSVNGRDRAPQRRRLAGVVVGLARAGADDPPQARGRRLRRRRQRLRPRPHGARGSSCSRRATGLPVRTIGSPGSGPGQLLNPSALTIDAGGTMVVADSGNQRIARFGTGGGYLGATTGVGDGPRDRGHARRHRAPTSPPRTTASRSSTRRAARSTSSAVRATSSASSSRPGRSRSTPPATCGSPTAATTASRSSARPASGCWPSGSAAWASASSCTRPASASTATGLLTVTDSDNNRVQQFALAAPASAPCAAPAPVGNPPPPKLPTLPAPVGPQVTLRVLRSAGLVGDAQPAAARRLRHRPAP